MAACKKQASLTVFIDPALATLVPKGTLWMAGVRLERLHGTPLYDQYITRGKLPIVTEFFKATGLDLNKDLWEILLVGDQKGPVAMLRGKFSEMGMEPKVAREGATRFGYGGFTFLGDQARAVAFLNPSTALAGSVPALKYIVDHRNESSGLPPAIQSRVAKISSANQVWFAGSPDVLPNLPLPSAAAWIRAVKFASGGLEVGQSVKGTFQAETASIDDANRLRDGVKGILGMARLSTATDSTALLQFFDSFRVEANGTNLRVQFEASPEALAELPEALRMPNLHP